MKAMVYHKYGPPQVLGLQEIDNPAVTDDGILVSVEASSVNWLDWHFLTGSPPLTRLMAGLTSPRNEVLGVDLAGKVEAVGAAVRQFQPGDAVFGSTRHGCFAEYVCVRQEEIKPKPQNVTFEEAAAVGAAATTALHGLRDAGQIEQGKRVLINGASGGVGCFAVQIAKAFNTDVTGVCSTANLEFVRSIGADHVMDYTQEDFAKSGDRYDLIFDVAAKRDFSECNQALPPQGIYVTSKFTPALVIKGKWISKTGSKKMVPLAPRPPTQSDLAFIRELLASRKLRPTIDRCYPLADLADALRYLAKGHARGKVVISVGDSRHEAQAYVN